MKIAILEDNADRQAVMRRCLADRFYTFDAHLFDDPAEMIRFLDEHLAQTLVICLDHDLEIKTGPDGRLVDPGTGRAVADYLAGKAPVCPVIIHTTKRRCRGGDEAGAAPGRLEDAPRRTVRRHGVDRNRLVLRRAAGDRRPGPPKWYPGRRS